MDGLDGALVAFEAHEAAALLLPMPDRTTKTVHVAAKVAQSLDGRLATTEGDSKWISGPEEREVTHALRARADAVLVGVGTVLTDNPRLTVRSVTGSSPTRVVLDARLRIPLTSHVLEPEAPTLVITSDRAPLARQRAVEQTGATVCVVPGGPDGVALLPALTHLYRRGICSLLVEGGGAIVTSFIAQRLVDRLIVSVSPLLIGRGVDTIGELGVRRMEQVVRLRQVVRLSVGCDTVIAGCPTDAERAPLQAVISAPET